MISMMSAKTKEKRPPARWNGASVRRTVVETGLSLKTNHQVKTDLVPPIRLRGGRVPLDMLEIP